MHSGPPPGHGARVDDGWTYQGLKTVVVENELLRVVVLADKGADLVSVLHKSTDTELLWRTPWGVRDPRTYVPASGQPTAVWLDCYEGGWQTVVPNGGHPGSIDGSEHPLHGDVSLVPWDVVALEQGPEQASVTLRVRSARSPVVVDKTVRLVAGSPVLVVTETVENVGSQPYPAVYGQHLAIGPPFLSQDCVIDLPGGTVLGQPVDYSPNHRLAAGQRSAWPHYPGRDGTPVDLSKVPGRTAGVEDQVYVTDLPEGWYAVTNTETGVGFAVTWPRELFPYLWYWQVFGGGHGYPWWGQTYNIGLEPFSSWDNQGVASAVANGSALVLQPGAPVTSRVTVTAYASRVGVLRVDPDGTVHTRA